YNMNVCIAINVGGQFVDSRKIVNFIFKTLFLGGIVGFIASFFIKSAEYSTVLSQFDAKGLLGVALFFFGYVLVFTVIALTRLFALFDLVYFTSDKLSLGFKFTLVAVILISAIIVAYFKMKETNVTAFIPALFLMIVITALELSLVLRAADVGFILLMLVPVLI